MCFDCFGEKKLLYYFCRNIHFLIVSGNCDLYFNGYFLQRRPMWRNARCALPSLSVTRRGEPEEQALCEAERKGETHTRIKGGERGNIVVRRRGVPIIKDFG